MNQHTKSPHPQTNFASDFYLNLFESSYDAIFVESLAGHILYANQAASDLFQYTRQELLQMNVDDLFSYQNYGCSNKFLAATAAGKSFVGDSIRQDGTRVQSEIRICSFSEQDEEYLAVFIRDITKHGYPKNHQQKFLASLREISLELLNQLELPKLFTNLLNHTCALFHTNNAYICLLKETDGITTIERISGLGLYEKLADYPFTMGKGLIGIVAQSGKPMIIPDYQCWSEKIVHQEFNKFKSGVAVPLKSDNQTIGVLCLAYEEAYIISPLELEFLEQFAEEASLAIVNARLHTSLVNSEKDLCEKNANLTAAHEELQASEEELRQQFDELLSKEQKIYHQNAVLNSLHDISLSLMNRLDLDDVLRQVVNNAAKLVNTEHGFIYLIDEESGMFERKIGLGLYAKDIGRKTKFTDGLVGKILDSGELMIINDYSKWENRLPGPFFDNIHNIVQVPLKIENQVIGTIGLALEDKNRIFTAEDIDLLKRFAELAAIALDNAALVTSYKKEISERKETENALRVSEENNQTLINALPDILVVLNRQGAIVDFRGNDKHLLFLSKEHIGKNVADILPSTAAALILHHTRAALETGCIQVFTHQLSDAAKTQYYETRVIKSGKKDEVLAIIRDITNKVRMEISLERLSMLDTLTGLYNRAFFEKEMLRISATPTTAVGFLVCDIDGLKFINDSLGNSVGDAMLKAVADILKAVFETKDIIARIGGDEFAVLLSPHSLQYIDGLCQNIRMQIERYNVENSTIPISLSMGVAVSKQPPFDMKQLLSKADNTMYREKLHRQKSTRSAIVHALLKALEARDFITEGHGDRLQNLMENFALSLGVPGQNMADLILFSQFHDIGKVGIPDQILFKPAKLTDDEFTVMRQHCEIGYNIAKSAPDLVPIANWILRHHEWWNGNGYPFGLAGEDIPLACRMLSIIDAFDAMTNDRPYRKALPYEHALKELKKFSGTQFDPNLVDPFVRLIKEHS